ncbi:polysaccharide biosynthesis/export family protein [Methylobacterium nodulans]|uniref:Polysaccharide export protein n=1 Tax=Methylobacterium nodulans (strain LMG 21967 / CNCM I-2342 / ORS 2060) TaxID=460265 RepID=B8ISQ6_METNO|nr:polysaccharide biosynthesis/export family protein [Methylobacterium nodulans]ACL60705.1 polysaccharide export protein [Methylobacterium nodulans ORS 2060]
MAGLGTGMRAAALVVGALAAAGGPWASRGAAAAEYRLQPGDVLEFSVAGVPEMRQKLAVNLDGEVSFPLIGEVKAAGRPVAELRETVKSLLPNRSLTLRGQDGKETLTVISGDEITLAIAEYRPVYVSGDVAKPGEQPYRAGLSVRQAVSLAGGYDLQRFRMESPILQTADLRGEYQTLWTDFARAQAEGARLRAELEGRRDFDRKSVTEAPLPAPVLNAIIDNEQKILLARNADFTRERDHLTRTVALYDSRITVLTEQRKKEDEGAELDASEIERINDLTRRGVVPITRALETRRLSLLSSTRALQIGVQAEQAKKDRQDAARAVERLEDQHRSDLLKELQDNDVKLAQTRAKLQAVGEKLLYTGVVRSQLVRGTGGTPQIAVYRRTDPTHRERIAADEETELQPGDTVEIALRVEYEFKPTQ